MDSRDNAIASTSGTQRGNGFDDPRINHGEESEDEETFFISKQLYTHRELVKKEIKQLIISRRNLLREKITGDMGNQESGPKRFRPYTFPPEIWEKILSSVTDGLARINCKASCKMLASMITGSKEELLFGEVLPFISGYLDKTDILNCRYICKRWCSDVDRVTESANLIVDQDICTDTPYTGSVSYKRIPSYPYQISVLSDIMLSPERTIPAMSLHSRNPLIGRHLWIDWSEIVSDTDTSPYSRVKKILSDVGSHLFHLEIFGNPFLLEPIGYFDMIYDALRSCMNLKTLVLKILNRDTECRNTAVEYPWNPAFIPWCPNLEAFQMTSNHTEWKYGMMIQDAFLRRYCSQLKCLKVSFWNEDLYCQLSWKKLTSLDVEKADSLTFLESLIKIEAPGLKQLSLQMSDSSVLQFRLLMRALNGFPVLKAVRLTFSENFVSFHEDEILKDEHTLEPVCSKTISLLSLELQDSHVHSMCFDYLTFFPFLKRLNVKVSGNNCAPNCNYPKREYGEYDCIQLGRFICKTFERKEDVLKPIYRSNVWQTLKRLEFLEIQSDWGSDESFNIVFSRARGLQ